MLVGAAGLRWASWVWLAVVAGANLHRVHQAPLAVVAVTVTGAVTVATSVLIVGAGWQRALRPIVVGCEVAAAAGILLADGWVDQGRLTGQSLAGNWPIPSILVAAMAGGLLWGVGTAALLGGARAVAVVVSGWVPGQGGRAALAVVSTSIEWIAFGAVCAVVIRLLRQTQRQLAEAEVRERIARDLHDGVLQTLSLIERKSDSPVIARLARDQERDLRSYLFGDYRREGSLAAVLRSSAGTFERSWSETTVTVSVSEDVAGLTGDSVDAIAGAVTEALTNAAKHGRASHTVVFADVDEDSGGVFVSVKDDGCGFDVWSLTEGVGIGHSIRGRIERVGGSIELASIRGEGAEVRMRVPKTSRKAGGKR
jgi:signal transduction histidine kinase